jgi:hypothetical protein
VQCSAVQRSAVHCTPPVLLVQCSAGPAYGRHGSRLRVSTVHVLFSLPVAEKYKCTRCTGPSGPLHCGVAFQQDGDEEPEAGEGGDGAGGDPGVVQEVVDPVPKQTTGSNACGLFCIKNARMIIGHQCSAVLHCAVQCSAVQCSAECSAVQCRVQCSAEFDPRYCTAQCSAVQCSVVLHCAVKCSAVPCSTPLRSAVQCRAVQCSAVQCSAVHCSTALRSAVQCSTALRSAVQCSAVQCSAVQCTVRYHARYLT